MKNKNYINVLAEEQDQYWGSVTFDQIIEIQTKNIKTHYISRSGEKFTAIKLPGREITGMPEGQYIRMFRLDRDRIEIEMLPINNIESINGVCVTNKTKWEVKGSSGNEYVVKLVGEKYVCNCKGFTYRKTCRHVDQIKKEVGK